MLPSPGHLKTGKDSDDKYDVYRGERRETGEKGSGLIRKVSTHGAARSHFGTTRVETPLIQLMILKIFEITRLPPGSEGHGLLMGEDREEIDSGGRRRRRPYLCVSIREKVNQRNKPR